MVRLSVCWERFPERTLSDQDMFKDIPVVIRASVFWNIGRSIATARQMHFVRFARLAGLHFGPPFVQRVGDLTPWRAGM